MNRKLFKTISIIFLIILFNFSIFGTNGYFSHGYSTEGKALAGAEVAIPLDTFSAVTNPALISFVDDGFQIGLGFFMPYREYTVKGDPSGISGTFPLVPQTVESDTNLFVMPKIGYKFNLKNNIDISINIYGNGGMNTNYDEAVYNGEKPTGVDLAQLFSDFTISKKIGENHSIGFSTILAYQRFSAEGLQAFVGFSRKSDDLTNNDYDNSLGYGARIGYFGGLSRLFRIGLSYQTKILMKEFDEYSGLFAEKGDFDIPSNLNAGFSSELMNNFVVSFNYQKIFYSDIKSIANNFDPADFYSGTLLGDEEGAGFGWDDMDIYKIGMKLKLNDNWSLMSGFSHGKQPIGENDVMLNILAPAVIENHITLGINKKLDNNNSFSFSISHGLSNSVSGYNPMEIPEQQKIEIKMHQWDFEIGYSF
ncbi:MAG TPA: outer membrane protein transport protein [Candidatus Mcinerneyibacterium sp.]|nr:outer membrane protein transport protein [Candidatus Mcinerneyibacterium sp.]